MPNEVFLLTRAGLAAMVSPRVADRILASTLQRKGLDPESIDAFQMRRLLAGPVRAELEAVLPSRGLRRNLDRLSLDLAQLPEDRPFDQTVLLPPASDPAGPSGEAVATLERPVVAVDSQTLEPGTAEVAGTEAARAATELDAVAVTESGGAATELDAELEVTEPSGAAAAEEVGDEFAASASAAEAAKAPPEDANPPAAAAPGTNPFGPAAGASRRLRTLSREEWAVELSRFTQIDHVSMVAVIDESGKVQVELGEGPELEPLSRLGRLALALLGKVEPVRSLQVSHSAGELFLFPVGTDLLVLFGEPALNLGAVLTTFASLSLEEEI